MKYMLFQALYTPLCSNSALKSNDVCILHHSTAVGPATFSSYSTELVLQDENDGEAEESFSVAW